ncbi:hypothetical protein J3458_018999 [Metarhizium acridum]|uniref:uncharacterized protein n=1 Tax=Metarhizium acridum TaxID=92637 RepID=UPI001C6B09E4|nr:hypothetical protein J3458_018999 [Metarhizium acridum]
MRHTCISRAQNRKETASQRAPGDMDTQRRGIMADKSTDPSVYQSRPQNSKSPTLVHSNGRCSRHLSRTLTSLPYPGYVEGEEELARRMLGEAQPQVVPAELIMKRPHA